jgi:hypothetical protein
MFRTALLAALLLAVTAASAHAAPSGGTLYVQQARNAELVGTRLVLHHPGARVTTFSDRPARQGGSQTLPAFVAAWTAAFGDDPPNAALELTDAPASRDVTLLELRAPRYDRRRDTLTYTVRPVTKAAGHALDGLAARADKGLRGRLGRATLFIDDAATPALELTVSGLPPGAWVQLQALPVGLQTQVTGTGTGIWNATLQVIDGEQVGVLDYSCAPTEPAPCSATLSVGITGFPSDAVLPAVASSTIPASGTTVTVSWADGAAVTVPPGQAGPLGSVLQPLRLIPA